MIIRRNTCSRRRGFTLIEAAFVTVVVGLSITSLLQLLAAGTVANNDSAETTTAINLATNLHEATLPMTFTQVVALNNTNYSPPVDSRLVTISELSSVWKQHIDVVYLDPNNLNGGSSGSTVQPTARATVTVYHNSAKVYSIEWTISNVP